MGPTPGRGWGAGRPHNRVLLCEVWGGCSPQRAQPHLSPAPRELMCHTTLVCSPHSCRPLGPPGLLGRPERLPCAGASAPTNLHLAEAYGRQGLPGFGMGPHAAPARGGDGLCEHVLARTRPVGQSAPCHTLRREIRGHMQITRPQGSLWLGRKDHLSEILGRQTGPQGPDFPCEPRGGEVLGCGTKGGACTRGVLHRGTLAWDLIPREPAASGVSPAQRWVGQVLTLRSKRGQLVPWHVT